MPGLLPATTGRARMSCNMDRMPIAIAYLVLAHRGPQQLRALCSLLGSQGASVWVHVDAKAPQPAFAQALAGLPRVQRLPQPLPIWWGGFNMVAATLRLCESALAAGADRLVLLSGMDFPIQPLSAVERALARPVDRIEMLRLPDPSLGPDGGLDRFRWMHRADAAARWGLPGRVPTLLHRRLLPWLHRRPPMGLQPLVGSQWWALQAGTVRRVLEALDQDPDLLRYFSGIGIPDESLFQTLVHQLAPDRPRTGAGRLITWDRHPKPYVYRLADWPELMASDALFARKFDFEQDPALAQRLLEWHRQHP
jgi:hypothetical protein